MSIAVNSVGTNTSKAGGVGLSAAPATQNQSVGTFLMCLGTWHGLSASTCTVADTVGGSTNTWHTTFVNNGTSAGAVLSWSILTTAIPTSNAVGFTLNGSCSAAAVGLYSFTGWTGTPTVDIAAQTGTGSSAGGSLSGTSTNADGLWIDVTGWNGPTGDSFSVTGGGVCSGLVTSTAIVGTSGQGATSNIAMVSAIGLNIPSAGAGSVSASDTTARSWASVGISFYDLVTASAGLVIPKTVLWAPQRAAIW